MLRLDHFAIAGMTLADAEQHVATAIGCPAVGHGVHDHFGTHNALWGAGGDFYIEAIAIDPAAPKLDHPRWFGLDEFSGPPRLATWILATDDMAATLAHLGSDFGKPVSLQRGTYRWQIAVPKSGANGFDGIAPSIIAWDGPAHPAHDLGQCGAQLRDLHVRHPNIAALADLLAPVLPDDGRVIFDDGPKELSARFDSPTGLLTLS